MLVVQWLAGVQSGVQVRGEGRCVQYSPPPPSPSWCHPVRRGGITTLESVYNQQPCQAVADLRAAGDNDGTHWKVDNYYRDLILIVYWTLIIKTFKHCQPGWPSRHQIDFPPCIVSWSRVESDQRLLEGCGRSPVLTAELLVMWAQPVRACDHV